MSVMVCLLRSIWVGKWLHTRDTYAILPCLLIVFFYVWVMRFFVLFEALRSMRTQGVQWSFTHWELEAHMEACVSCKREEMHTASSFPLGSETSKHHLLTLTLGEKLWETKRDTVTEQREAGEGEIVRPAQVGGRIGCLYSPALRWAPVQWQAARRVPRAEAPPLLQLSAAAAGTQEYCSHGNRCPVRNEERVRGDLNQAAHILEVAYGNELLLHDEAQGFFSAFSQYC